MLKRTTHYLFQVYGNVYDDAQAAVERRTGHTLTVTHKAFDRFYRSELPTTLRCQSGIALLVVSKDGIHRDAFVVHRTVVLHPNVWFNLVAISEKSTLTLSSDPTELEKQPLDEPFRYRRAVSQIDLQEILTCFYQVRNPNYRFPGERHNDYELTYVDHGALETTVEGMDFTLTDGDLMLYYPGQFHTQATDSAHTCSHLTIVFDMHSALQRDLSQRVFHANDAIRHALAGFMAAIQANDALHDELALAYLKEVLVHLYRFDSQADDAPAVNPMQQHYENTLLNEILLYIHDNLYENFTVEDLCQKFFISRSSLQALFRDNIDITPKHYISNLKLNQAKLLLQKQRYTVSEIADKLGFSSVHYFSRKFKGQYGLSPSAYAKSIRP